MAWYAIYDTATGRLIETTEKPAAQLPAGSSQVTLDHKPDWSKEKWITATLSLDPLYSLEVVDVTGKVRLVSLDHEPTAQDTYDAIFPFISKLQLRKLFTFAERSGLDNIESSAADAAMKAAVVTIKGDFAVADFISLQDPLTIEAITMLETLGLLAAGRAAQILAGTLPA